MKKPIKFTLDERSIVLNLLWEESGIIDSEIKEQRRLIREYKGNFLGKDIDDSNEYNELCREYRNLFGRREIIDSLLKKIDRIEVRISTPINY